MGAAKTLANMYTYN